MKSDSDVFNNTYNPEEPKDKLGTTQSDDLG